MNKSSNLVQWSRQENKFWFHFQLCFCITALVREKKISNSATFFTLAGLITLYCSLHMIVSPSNLNQQCFYYILGKYIIWEHIIGNSFVYFSLLLRLNKISAKLDINIIANEGGLGMNKSGRGVSVPVRGGISRFH